MRDENGRTKRTMASVVEQGKRPASGFSLICRTFRGRFTTQRTSRRTACSGRKAWNRNNYRLFVGLTSDSEQIKKAVQLAKENKNVVGLKLLQENRPEI